MNFDTTALITIAISLVMCFFGFKVQKLVITLAWFGLGFFITGKIGGNFLDGNTLLITQIVVGIILGSLGYKLEKLALAIAIGYLTYGAIGPYITMFDGNMATAVQIGISILVGILSTLFIKPIVVFVTSVAGASLIKKAIPVFITLDPTILTIIFIGFVVIGVFTQLKSA
jgi:hypothetical protein